MTTTNQLDVAKGTVDSLGVLFMWTQNPMDTDLLAFDTVDEMVTYVMDKLDSCNITFEQGNHKRLFTVWEMPWTDAQGSEGEAWTEYA